MFDDSSMELGNSEGYFGRVDLGLSILEGVLCNLTALYTVRSNILVGSKWDLVRWRRILVNGRLIFVIWV